MSFFKKFISRALGFLFEILYTDFAWAYDAVAWLSSIGQWRAWQRTAISELSPGESLEIGFGTGHIFKELTSTGRLIFGVDLSRQMTRITQNRLRKAILPQRIAQASSFALPFPKSSFISVLSTFPSNYIYERKTFEEVYRVLKPGGKMVLIPGVQKITGAGPSGNIILRILDKASAWLYALTGEVTNPGEDWRDELIKELDSLGFSTSIESVTLERAVVMRVVAKKAIPPS